jgi:hypothetical protein
MLSAYAAKKAADHADRLFRDGQDRLRAYADAFGTTL